MKKSKISSFFFPVQHSKYPPLNLSSLTKAEWVIQWNICCIYTRLYTQFFFFASIFFLESVESTSLHQYTESHSGTPRDGWSFESTRTHTEEALREAVCRKVLKKMFIYWQKLYVRGSEATCAPSISKNLHYAFLYLDLYYVHIHREIFSFQLLNTLTFDNETHWANSSKTRNHNYENISMKFRISCATTTEFYPTLVRNEIILLCNVTYRADQSKLWFFDRDRYNNFFHRNPVAFPSWVEVEDYQYFHLMIWAFFLFYSCFLLLPPNFTSLDHFQLFYTIFFRYFWFLFWSTYLHFFHFHMPCLSLI